MIKGITCDMKNIKRVLNKGKVALKKQHEQKTYKLAGTYLFWFQSIYVYDITI